MKMPADINRVATGGVIADLELLNQPDQPRAYDLRTVAAALGVSYERVRGWAKRGALQTLPTPPGTTKLVHLGELMRLAADGWPVDPEPLVDSD